MNSKAFTVSEISKYISTLLKRDPMLINVFVEGEVSNFKKSSGNIYFSLKDEDASIKCIIFRNMEISKTLQLSDGDKISLRASVITYEKGGYYQLLVKEVINTGIGDIYRQYELLKEKFKNLGYFDESHKRQITKMPKNIGVITSPNGAAIRDIITTIRRRFPIVNIYIYPAIVQGQNAPKSLINGIEVLNSYEFIDFIVIGRGGGSFEDLNCFNDEELLLKIFNSKKPIISAVGHEVDNMLSDFVSDLRAATPTAAAELCTPNLVDLKENLNKKLNLIEKAYSNYFIEERKKLDYYFSLIKVYNPLDKICKLKEENQKLNLRIDRQVKLNIIKERDRLEKFSIYLMEHNPIQRIELTKDELNNIKKIIKIKTFARLNQERLKLKELQTRVELHNDLRIKKLGYIRATSKGAYINSAKSLKVGELLKLHFEDGIATTEVRSIENGK